MTDVAASPAPEAIDITNRPFTGSVTAQLTRAVGVDQTEVITYDHGTITRQRRVVGGPSPLVIVDLGPAELRDLRARLEEELHERPAGVDPLGLRVFVVLIDDVLEDTPSARFDHAGFGDVTTGSDGTTIGHLRIGIDVVGSVRDDHGTLSYEQHVVTLSARPYQPLVEADRASLARALRSYLDTPGANHAWAPILADALSDQD